LRLHFSGTSGLLPGLAVLLGLGDSDHLAVVPGCLLATTPLSDKPHFELARDSFLAFEDEIGRKRLGIDPSLTILIEVCDALGSHKKILLGHKDPFQELSPPTLNYSPASIQEIHYILYKNIIYYARTRVLYPEILQIIYCTPLLIFPDLLSSFLG